MTPTFFATPAAFRRWLEAHHRTAAELWVGFYKKATGRPSLTWPESVDEALCFGWIDGIRRRIDAERYAIRFTPRRQGSAWSAVNTRRAEALRREGRMAPAGVQAFEARDREQSRRASYEQGREVVLDRDAAARFRANRAAWAFFEAQPPGYRRMATWWVVSAKQDATRARRLDALIRQSAAGQRLDPMRPLGTPPTPRTRSTPARRPKRS